MPVFYQSPSELATITNTFYVDNVATDPTTVTLTVLAPGGTSTSYTYAASQITRTGTGAYSKDIACTIAGTWAYVWTGTGTASDVAAGTWIVDALPTATLPADRLATPADLQAALGNPADFDSERAALLVELATAAVQQMAGGQRILQVTETITILGTADSWLDLPQLPVTAVSSVIRDGITLTLTTDYKVFGNRLWSRSGWQNNIGLNLGWYPDYNWRPSYGFDAYLGPEPGTVQVTYTHGYAAGAQELQLARSAVITLASGVYDNPSGATSESIDDYTVQYARASSAIEAAAAEAKYLQAAIRKAYGRRGSLVRVG